MSKTPPDFRYTNELNYLLSLLPQPQRPALAAKFGESLDSSRRRRDLPAANSTSNGSRISVPEARPKPQSESPSYNRRGAGLAQTAPASSSTILSPFNASSNGVLRIAQTGDCVCPTIATAASRAHAMRMLIKRCVELARKHGGADGKFRFVPAGFPGTTVSLERNATGWSVDVRCGDGWSARQFSDARKQLQLQFDQAGLGGVDLDVRENN